MAFIVDSNQQPEKNRQPFPLSTPTLLIVLVNSPASLGRPLITFNPYNSKEIFNEM